jgi:RimJ/RimL family protein N-acetyltransferase
MNNQFTIRQFKAEEVATYKAIRLEALQSDPGSYGNPHAVEAAMSDEEWIDRVVNPLHARFGLYDGNTLIGLTGIIINKDNHGEAYMTQSYIRKAYRGRGLSKLLYEARLAWARERNVKRLTISHRKSNLASKGANQKFGFVFTHTEPRTWPDGITEDNFLYELIL